LTSTSQDPDALYNALLYGSYDLFGSPTPYPGHETTLEFANGTVQTYPTVVTINSNLTGITSGDDMYKTFCVIPEETEEGAPAKLKHRLAKRELALPSNPTPNVYDESNSVQGYWDGNVADGVTVIALLGFDPNQDDTETKFQEAVGQVIEQSTQAGKDKLIIDLTMNGGGTVFLALDTLVQLFPDTNPDTKNNLRASSAMHAMVISSSANTTEAQNADPNTAVDETEVSAMWYLSPFAWQTIQDPENKKFKSIEEMYGPFESGPGKFSSFFQENYTYNDRTILDKSSFTINVADPEAKRPFKTENMVILTDG